MALDLALFRSGQVPALPPQLANVKDLTLVYGEAHNGKAQVGYAVGTERNEEVTLYLNVCLDRSGSMSEQCGGGKTRLEVVLECLKSFCESKYLADDDSLVVYSFDEEVKIRCCCLIKKYDHDRLEGDIKGFGGCTRLWDGMVTSYKNMRDHAEVERKFNKKEIIRYMLVFTDGGDTSSIAKLDDLCKTIAKAPKPLPNFNLVIIAAGVDGSDADSLRRLCQPDHCKLIEVHNVTDVDITAAFEEAITHIRFLILRNTEGEQMVQSYRGSKLGARKMDKQVGGLCQKMDSVKIVSTVAALQADGGAQPLVLPSGGSRPASAKGGNQNAASRKATNALESFLNL